MGMSDIFTIDPLTVARTLLRDHLAQYILGQPGTDERRVGLLVPTWKHAVERHVIHMQHQFPGKFNGPRRTFELDLPIPSEIIVITGDELEQWMSMNFLAIGIDESEDTIDDPEVHDWARRRVHNPERGGGMLWRVNREGDVTGERVR